MELVTPYPVLRGTNTFPRINELYQTETKTYETQQRINPGLNTNVYTLPRTLGVYGIGTNLGEEGIGLRTANYGTIAVVRNVNQTPNTVIYETPREILTENQNSLEEVVKIYKEREEEKPFDLEEMLRSYGIKKREETLIT